MNTSESIYFRDLAKHLYDPTGSMHFLVYVREPESILSVARWIRDQPIQPWRGQPELAPIVFHLAKRNIVRLSSRHPLPDVPERALIDPRSINPFQRGEAQRVSLYGVVHIPDLIKEQLRSGLQSNGKDFAVTRSNGHELSH